MGGIKYKAQDVVEKSFLLSSDIILNQGYMPHVIYKLSRGGDIFGNVASEIMKFYGIKNLLASVHAKHYGPNNKIQETDLVDILGYTLPPWDIRPNSDILICEDLNDTFHTVRAVVEDILDQNHGITKENVKTAFLIFKDRLAVSLDSKVDYRRIYAYGDPTPEMRDTMHSAENSIQKPDFYLDKIGVPDPSDSKYWIDIHTHELVGFSPKEIMKAYGETVFKALLNVNFTLLEKKYGKKFVTQMKTNLASRLSGNDNLLQEIKIPTK